MRVLIAGCGYVGTALGTELAGAGHTVWGLRRSAGDLPPGIRPLVADLLRPADLEAIPDGVDHVVYAASPNGPSDQAYQDAYVRGLSHLLHALDHRRVPVRRVVLTTSTAVYAQTGGRWVDETSPTEPTHFGGQCLLEGERTLRQAPFQGVAVRLAGIYGPGRTGLLRRVHEGRARCPERPRYSNRIHRDDCAGALAHLLAHPEPAAVYIGADAAPDEVCEVYGWVADQLGVPHPTHGPAAEERSGRRGRSNKRCRNDRLLGSGYRLRFPSYREGYAPLLSAMRPG